MAGRCQALYLSDERRCEAAATSGDGLFCAFHARQCFGLYKGYKRRNARLDRLEAHPPALLQGIQLHELQVSQEKDEDVLKECFDHLFERYSLLERVIKARRLHHSRFYAIDLDYGHENYLNQLSAQRTPLLRAIEKVVKRTGEVLYEKHKWFDWVRQLEDEEEQERDAEKKKVKQEAALFRRHVKELDARMNKLRAEENEKQQAAYLDKTWHEVRSANGDLDEEAIEDDWDPIEDNVEEERETYLDLLRHFLWLQPSADDHVEVDPGSEAKIVAPGDSVTEPQLSTTEDASAKSKNAKKKARQKTNAKVNGPGNVKVEAKEQSKPGAVHIESPAELRERLRVGQEYPDQMKLVRQAMGEDPVIETRFPPLESEEIEHHVSDITEIKQLLFCRVLLSHASLLQIALRSSSIEHFLAQEDVSSIDLRDLCLKLEQPTLQQLRDACADFRRADVVRTTDEEDGRHHQNPSNPSKYKPKLTVKPKVPKAFQSKREKAMQAQQEGKRGAEPGTLVDFGVIDDQSQYYDENVKVKVCGRTIHYYPSDKAMSRGGWLQFSIIAKDCSLNEAVGLCRHWDEFYELVTLTLHTYFPASAWMGFVESQEKHQLFKLSFFPYHQMDMAEQNTHRVQSARGHSGPRQHIAVEMRNWICGIMKRNDPVTRRFIQYMAMQSSRMLIFVRDVVTGDVLVRPPDEELWLVRQKVGYGRASKNEWTVSKSVGPAFLDEMEQHRKWSLNFQDYYDIIIFDLEAGAEYPPLINDIQGVLFKAHRVRKGTEMFKPAESILRSLGTDPGSGRCFDLKPGDTRRSVWSITTDPTTQHGIKDNWVPDEDGRFPKLAFPDEWLYNEADRLEDLILFPHEQAQPDKTLNSGTDTRGRTGTWNAINGQQNDSFIPEQQDMLQNIGYGPDLNRFILGLDSEDEIDEGDIAKLDKLWKENRPRRKKGASRPVPKKSKTKPERNSNVETENPGLDDDDLDDDDSNDDDLDDDDLDKELSKPVFAALAKMLMAWKDFCGYASVEDMSDSDSEPSNDTMFRRIRSKRRDSEEDVQYEWEIFIARERAHTFKKSFHAADMEPHADKQWNVYQRLARAQQAWRSKEGVMDTEVEAILNVAPTYRTMAALGVNHKSHHRIIKDAFAACDLVSFYFDHGNEAFLGSELGSEFQDSLLLKHHERASNIPNRRSRMSNKTRPREHFTAWDQRSTRIRKDFDVHLRPMIARLYRAGVICNSYTPSAAGQAMCLTEPDRPNEPDLFFDWRVGMPDSSAVSHMANPLVIEPLLNQARSFAKSNFRARFSLIKIWSAPHFWPLSMGLDKRQHVSFMDTLTRMWEWIYAPKDMPYSEWSMHKNTSDKLNAFDYFSDPVRMDGDKVKWKIDTVLVMAKGVENCRFLSSAATFAITTRPWTFEVDPWKSFYNVDISFLEQLDSKFWI